jgi:hypothetical protein
LVEIRHNELVRQLGESERAIVRVQPIESHNKPLPWVWIIWIASGNQHMRAFTWQELITFAVTAAALYVGVVGRGRRSWLFPKPYREVLGADRTPKSPVLIEQLCDPLVAILVDPSWIADQEQGPAAVVVRDLDGWGLPQRAPATCPRKAHSPPSMPTSRQ